MTPMRLFGTHVRPGDGPFDASAAGTLSALPSSQPELRTDRSGHSATMGVQQLGRKKRPQRGYSAKTLRRHFSLKDDGN
jgi:hypothetical protein